MSKKYCCVVKIPVFRMVFLPFGKVRVGQKNKFFTCFYLFLSVFSSSAHVCDTKNGHFETVSFLALMSQKSHEKVS